VGHHHQQLHPNARLKLLASRLHCLCADPQAGQARSSLVTLLSRMSASKSPEPLPNKSPLVPEEPVVRMVALPTLWQLSFSAKKKEKEKTEVAASHHFTSRPHQALIMQRQRFGFVVILFIYNPHQL
jgi:hypothetical protein